MYTTHIILSFTDECLRAVKCSLTIVKFSMSRYGIYVQREKTFTKAIHVRSICARRCYGYEHYAMPSV
jgi:hypothetical protein